MACREVPPPNSSYAVPVMVVRHLHATFCACLVALASAGCGQESSDRKSAARPATPETIEVSSPAFAAGQKIPAKHTCEGEDLSPTLEWHGVPPAARSLALICDDPDAPGGTWTHWVLYGLAPSETSLPEGVAKTATVFSGVRQGLNDFKRIGFGGPCPPPGAAHRYVFRLLALDTPLDLAPGATRQQIEGAMEGHILARGELIGIYQKTP
jgi:Raf kinase inhibitor-like YbhB/YbcL family protein